MYKNTRLMIKTSNNICRPKIYNKAIKDYIYKSKWDEAIDKKL